MRSLLALAFFFAVGLAGFAQTPVVAVTQELPKDPRAILAAAAPYYDFSDPALKPFHLKASYQLYDEKGKPTEQGTFEYWWASPKVNRRTWTRAGWSYTDWYTAGGPYAYLSTGEEPSFFEHQLASALLSPLPKIDEFNSSHTRIERSEVKLGKIELPCVVVIPNMSEYGENKPVPIGLFPTYCFDPDLPALRVSYSLGALAEGFDSIVKTQGRFLPQEIHFDERNRALLDAKVEKIDGLDPSDPALKPDPHARYPRTDKVQLDRAMIAGKLIKNVAASYPDDARAAHVSGPVLLGVTIGRDGRVHQIHVIKAPWPSLAGSAVWAVSQWKFTSFLRDGEPVEVDSTVEVDFHLY